MGKDSEPEVSTQTNEPPEWLKPYLIKGAERLEGATTTPGTALPEGMDSAVSPLTDPQLRGMERLQNMSPNADTSLLQAGGQYMQENLGKGGPDYTGQQYTPPGGMRQMYNRGPGAGMQLGGGGMRPGYMPGPGADHAAELRGVQGADYVGQDRTGGILARSGPGMTGPQDYASRVRQGAGTHTQGYGQGPIVDDAQLNQVAHAAARDATMPHTMAGIGAGRGGSGLVQQAGSRAASEAALRTILPYKMQEAQLGLNRELGMGQLGLSEEMGRGAQDINVGQLGLAQNAQSNAARMGNAQFGLQQGTAAGQLGLAQDQMRQGVNMGNAAQNLARAQGIGQLGLGTEAMREQMGLGRGQLGLATEMGRGQLGLGQGQLGLATEMGRSAGDRQMLGMMPGYTQAQNQMNFGAQDRAIEGLLRGGAMEQSMGQRMLDERRAMHQYGQNEELSRVQQYLQGLGVIAPNSGGTQTSTTTGGDNGPSMFSQLLGTGMMAAGTFFGGPMGGMAGGAAARGMGLMG